MKTILVFLLVLAFCVSLNSCVEPTTNQVRSNFAPTTDSGKARQIAQQVAAIEAEPHSPLPRAEQTSVDSTSQIARMAISNDTDYTLTVLYSGPTAQSVVLSPKAVRTIALAVGGYRVAARVDAPDVQPFAGSDELQGGSYDNTFYIQTVRY